MLWIVNYNADIYLDTFVLLIQKIRELNLTLLLS